MHKPRIYHLWRPRRFSTQPMNAWAMNLVMLFVLVCLLGFGVLVMAPLSASAAASAAPKPSQPAVHHLNKLHHADTESPNIPRDSIHITANDIKLPGTQPGGLTDLLSSTSPVGCSGCHVATITGGAGASPPANYYGGWNGSLMGNSARDPYFRSALAIANKDIDNVGSLCLRCHSPSAALEGRNAADGSQINSDDLHGITCVACHRMVPPSPFPGESARDAAERAAIPGTPYTQNSSAYILDRQDVRRGPFDVAPPHGVSQSAYLTSGQLCGNCHDIYNPLLSYNSNKGEYELNALDTPPPANAQLFSVQRTYSEWAASKFNNGGVSELSFWYPGLKRSTDTATGAITVCQDCHMPRNVGPLINGGTNRLVASHAFYGGLQSDAVDTMIEAWNGTNGEFDNNKQSDTRLVAQSGYTYLRQLAVSLSASAYAGQLVVTVTNQTGHKFPTGYEEGRRAWIKVEGYDDVFGQVVFTSGVFSPSDGRILPGNAPAKIYEVKNGLTEQHANAIGRPELVGPGFHSFLNNKVFTDTRIPPRGFTNAAFDAAHMEPVGIHYADGQYWDNTVYQMNPCTSLITVSVQYQQVTGEYVDFLSSNANFLVDDAVRGPTNWGNLISGRWTQPETLAEKVIYGNPRAPSCITNYGPDLSMNLTSLPAGHENGLIAFTNGNTLYMADADGQNVQTVASFAPAVTMDGAVFSPDGTRIAFAAKGLLDSGKYDIYTIPAQANAGAGSVTNISHYDGADELYPSWSPDSTRLLVVSNRDAAGPTGKGKLYIVNSDGSTYSGSWQKVTDWLSSMGAFSPDGTRVAYTGYQNDDAGEIYVINTNGFNNTHVFTNVGLIDEYPIWSPDGNFIAFNSTHNNNAAQNYEMVVVDAAGTSSVALSNNSVLDQALAWSPDGTRLLFKSARNGGIDLFTLAITDTNDVRDAGSGYIALGRASWQTLLKRGAVVPYRVVLDNPEPIAGTGNLVVTVPITGNLRYISTTVPSGWACSTPFVGARDGELVCRTSGGMPANSRAVFDVYLASGSGMNQFGDSTLRTYTATAMLTGMQVEANWANAIAGQVRMGGAAPRGQLQVEKVALANPAPPLIPLTYKIIISNTGTQGAGAVRIEDNLPLELSDYSASASQGNCSVFTGSEPHLTCNLGDVLGVPGINTAVVWVTGTAPITIGAVITNTAYLFDDSGAVGGDPGVAVVTVNKGQQVISFPPVPDQLKTQTFALNATVNSGLPISYASLTPSVCTVAGDQVTTVAEGVCTIRASRAGNLSYLAAADVERSFTVVARLPTFLPVLMR